MNQNMKSIMNKYNYINNRMNSNNNRILKKKIKSKNSIKILKEIIRIIQCKNKNKKKVKVKKIYSNY